MNKQRMIEILAGVLNLSDVMTEYLSDDPESFSLDGIEALAAMQQYAEEQTATLRAELERLKQCEAIVRELAERPHRRGREHPHIIDYIKVIDKARQWVKNNPK